jgi:ubiquinone/menaquinone biosynthesis C-methylase UbiE
MKILVGVGPDAAHWRAQGWDCNDIQPFEGVNLPGPCWDLAGVADNSVDEILAKGMLEHLTYHEVAKSFAEWRRVLKPGGFFTAEVPDVEEYITEFIKMKLAPETIGGEGGGAAEGEPADGEVCGGIERWLRRAIYGWQRWPGDEHRSGWTEKLYDFYLDKHFGGRHEIRRMAYTFDDDAPVSRVRHLWARAWKEQE